MYQTGRPMLLMYEHTKNSMTRKTRYRARVRRLRFHGPDGKPRRRPETVENDIADMLSLPHAERAARARDACNETLVYFIRRRDDSDEQYFEAFVGELDLRIVDLASCYVRGLPEVTGEDIVGKVQWELRKLVLAETGSARTEFLEVAFALAVKKRTLQLVNLYLSSPWSRRDTVYAEDDDGEMTQRELQRIADGGPGPEGILLDKEEQARCRELCETALAAITNPRHRQAATLHWIEGWPIQSTVKGKDDLATYFRTTPGRIKQWLKQAMKEMRAALGAGVTE
jgi:hypothetical protein